MGYCWTQVSVFNHEFFLGDFYTNKEKRSEIIEDINALYGRGNWSKFYTD